MQPTSTITALLGPTNTGKTHRAVEAMLAHDTGMIGLPLRLLAREIYDRVSTRVGEARVALVTGEEKRVPPRPDYWVCTVEAMPVDRAVDFVAVDEVQLAAHPQRGHVFTQRLLSARGRRETWFLGAEGMRGLLHELVPTAEHREHPRLSRLAFTGSDRLARLPARSAVVAFSLPQVYELAERMRHAFGGVAVVLGALSPRTRNAQVAMFQAGEVDHLVATDAIGMGLNLALDHVAFASLRKFDGREVRDLETQELAQIAGRAGRFRNDGTFGALAPLVLPAYEAVAIENHHFPAVRKLVWRNEALEFASVEALLASLKRPAPTRALRLVEEPDDTAALAALAQLPVVRERARGEASVKLLWEVCTVPDFRKLLLEAHVALLAELYEQLTGPRGVLETDWVAARVRELDDPDGDIDTLLGRIAAIRTWTYLSHRGEWLADARAWQERTRAVEDRLSDALHERLVQRFVDKGRPRPASREARPREPARAVGTAPAAETPAPAPGAPPAPSHPFARLAALREAMAPTAVTPRGPSLEQWVEALVAAPHEDFALDARGVIAYRGRPAGQLVRGSRLVLPDVKLLDAGDLRAGAHARIQRRLVAYARDAVGELLAPLRAVREPGLSVPARQVLYQLEQRLGTVLAREVAEPLSALTDADRAALRAAKVEPGVAVAYLPGALRPAALVHRAALCSAFFGREHSPAAPKPGAVSVGVVQGVDAAAYEALGFPVFARRALRADVAERVARAVGVAGEASEGSAGSEAGEEGAGGASEAPDALRLATWMGCPAWEVERTVRAVRASLVGRSEAP